MLGAGIILLTLAALTAAAYGFAWVVGQAALSEAETFEYAVVHPEMFGGETASGMAGGGEGRRKADRLGSGNQRTNPFRTGDTAQ